MCTYFEPNNDAHRTVAEWRQAWSGKTWQFNVKAYARLYGEAKVLRADGSVVRYWMDGGTLCRRLTAR